eukprot:TRINITY_DN8884_c0_g2_i1.p1 TRINITY_DN8884_c0_g2~~TRINITY_DN8884_c0_g2_i1.p1  ORF type:complete len:433 (+),score=65.53 TRINITY_DN8884_c0_g2_i1:52-1350(+)
MYSCLPVAISFPSRLVTAAWLFNAGLLTRAQDTCAENSYVSGSDNGHLSAAWNDYNTGDQGFAYYEETADKHMHLSCFLLDTGANSTSLKKKITVEFKGHKIGIATRNVNGLYPLNTVAGIDKHKAHMVDVLGESKATEEVTALKTRLEKEGRIQDSFNSFHFSLKAINGVDLGDADSDTTTQVKPDKTGEGFCMLPDGEHGFFGDTAKVKISNGKSEDLVSMVSYMFRNAAAKEASKSEVTYTMDLGDLKCATETILGIKPKSGGGVTVKFEVRAGGFVDEDGLNERMTFKSLADQIQILLPKKRMLVAVGLEPIASDNETHMALSVATQFVCDKTKALVTGTISELSKTNFLMTLNPADAPESCGTMYWDPVQNPGPCPDDGDYACAKGFADGSFISRAASKPASTTLGWCSVLYSTFALWMLLGVSTSH